VCHFGRHSGAMPTGPRKARPDDRLRIEPGNLEMVRANARPGTTCFRIPAQRADRVQVSPPHSAPTQPSTLSVSGPDTATLLA